MVIRLNERQLGLILESSLDYIGIILDYIRGFGVRGKLSSFVGKLSDYYEDAFSIAYDWACKSTDGVRRDGFQYFRHNFKVDVLGHLTFNKRGLIYVERSIDIDASGSLDDLSFSSVGECWSWKRRNSRSYCADFSLLNNNVVNVVLCGYVHPDSIDWVETIYLNSYGMKDETEVRMNSDAVVEVSYVRINGNVYRLGGSYLLNAGSDKYRK